MLAGKMSNQDEDEVLDELEAMEAEMSGTKLPDAPTADLPEPVQTETAKERARRRARERAEEQANEPMLA
jgi:charged multivesicular body protein 6